MRQFVYLTVLSAAILVQGCGGGSTEPAPVQTQSVEKNPTTPDELRALPTEVTRNSVKFEAVATVTGKYATTGGYQISTSDQAGFVSVQANRDNVDWSQVQITGYAYRSNDTLITSADVGGRLSTSLSNPRRAYFFVPSHPYSELAIRLRFPDQTEQWLLTQKLNCICNHLVLGPGNMSGIFAPRVEPVLTVKGDEYGAMPSILATILFKQDGITTRKDVSDGLFTYGERDKIIERRGFSLLDAKRYLISKGYTATGYRISVPSYIADVIPLADTGIISLYNIEGISHFVWVTGVDADYLYLASPYFGNVAIPYASVPSDTVILAISRTASN